MREPRRWTALPANDRTSASAPCLPGGNEYSRYLLVARILVAAGSNHEQSGVRFQLQLARELAILLEFECGSRERALHEQKHQRDCGCQRVEANHGAKDGACDAPGRTRRVANIEFPVIGVVHRNPSSRALPAGLVRQKFRADWPWGRSARAHSAPAPHRSPPFL